MSIMKNPLVKKFGKDKRWVNYQLMMMNGRETKIPFSPITKRKASSTDEKTWGTYDDAVKLDKDHVGIVFAPDQLLLGIDIDHCINDQGNIEHEYKEQIAELILTAGTYTEISPSGTGLHLYFGLTSALGLEANRSGNFEAYTSGRYFTVTGNSYHKEPNEIRTITPEEAIALLKIIFYPWGKEVENLGPDISSTTHSKTSTSSRDGIVQTGLLQQVGPVIFNTPNDDVIAKMLASKGGEKIQALMDGDMSAHKNNGSSADMALLSHLAFWTGRNGAQMEQIWLSTKLGSREKTQKRKDYRDRSITAAIKNCKEIYESNAAKIEKAHPALDLLFVKIKGEKVFTQNVENISRILKSQNRFRYDAFKNTLEVLVGVKWRDLEDHDFVKVQAEIQVAFPCFNKVGKEMVTDAVKKISHENMVDSAIDYLTALTWDGTERLGTWLSKTYGVPDDVYYRAVGANWLKGLVKRLVHPGCKFDYVLVLEGEQGIKKSTSLNVLGSAIAGAPSWHVETTMATDNKDFFMQFEGKAIIEFSEGETLSRTEVKKMKAIITTQVDKYRPAYGHLSVDHPRRCVFAMTTNQKEYLKDETGNRRWLPVACEGIADIEWLKENRDQLYAEAYARVMHKEETVHEFPEEETFAMQSQRRIQDPNTDLVCDWYVNRLKDADREDGITVHMAYRDALNGGMTSGKPLDRFHEMNLADIFKTVLKLEKRRKMLGGTQNNRWYATEKTPTTESNDDIKSPIQAKFGVFGE
jgi:hypothetical protein